MRRLIVSGDDLGAGSLRDAGIFRALESGILTSLSLLANGPSFASAASRARGDRAPLGIHLNLADGRALTGPIGGLTEGSGAFLGKAASRKALALGRFDAEAARRELRAQIRRVLEAGIEPTHLDSHQHCFLFPALTPMILELAFEHGIGTLRRPRMAEAMPDTGIARDLRRELELYRRLAPAVERALDESGLRSPLGLFGMPLLNRLDERALLHCLRQLPPGQWELMCHPGLEAPGDPFGGAQRLQELEALCSPAVRELVEAGGIELIHFGELGCV